MNCAHCRNLNLNFTGHIVKSCPVLASTNCRNCKQLGHTARYCTNIPIAPGLPPSESTTPSFSWAKAAKKAVTEKDIEESEALKQKEIEDKKKKKQLEHEAYLERKAKREAIAKEKQERLMRSYELYCKHMWYQHGPGYLGCIRLSDAPDCFHDLIERGRYEADEKEMEREMTSQKAEKTNRLSTMELHDKIEEWLDESRDSYNHRYRQENAKIWLEEQLLSGHIVVGKDGKYRYYG